MTEFQAVNDSEVRQLLGKVISTSRNRTARRVFTRSLELLDRDGYRAAASHIARSLDKTERAMKTWHSLFLGGLVTLCVGFWGAVVVLALKAVGTFVAGI